MAQWPCSTMVALGLLLLCCTVTEGVALKRSLVFRRMLAAGSVGTESSSVSGNCRVVGPCLPCTATEKNSVMQEFNKSFSKSVMSDSPRLQATEAVCDESGYRQAVDCPSAQTANVTDPRRLGDVSGTERRDSDEIDGTEDRGSSDEGAGKKLLQAGGADTVISTLQACWPEGRDEGLTVLGFETIVALVLTVAAPVMVYRRRKAGSNASTQGMQRIPSNNRF